MSPTVRIIAVGHGAWFVELYMINVEVEWIGERDMCICTELVESRRAVLGG